MTTQITPKPSKLKYQLKVLVRPWLWLRLEKYNKTFDKWLWSQMNNSNNNIEPYICKVFGTSRFVVWFAGEQIWIDNPTIFDVSLAREADAEFSASRATALRFREKYTEYKEQQIMRLQDRLQDTIQEN